MRTNTTFGKLTAIFAVSLLISIFAFSSVYAAPANPFPQEFRQADGTVIVLTGGGDESFNWFEDVNGNVVVFDLASRNFCYAYIRNGELHPNPAHIVGSSSRTHAGAMPLLKADDIMHLAAEAEPIAPKFDYLSFVDRHSLFNRMSIDDEGNINFDAVSPYLLGPINDFQTQEIFPMLIEFTKPINFGGTDHYSRFRDSRFEEEYGFAIYDYIYEDLPGIDLGTTATAYWGRKFYDPDNPTGSVVGYFNEQANGVLSAMEQGTQFFAPAPELQSLLPEGVDRVTGILNMQTGNSALNFVNVPYEVYFDREWNIFRVTFDMAHPAPTDNSSITRILVAAAMDVIMYDDDGFDRNPTANNWPRLSNTGHTPTNGIPPHVHPYVIIAGHDSSSGNGAGTGQTWAHAFSTLNNNNGDYFVGNNPGGIRKRWSGRSYAHNGELFNGASFGIGATSHNFATMDIGVITHEFGHTLGVADTYDTAGNSLSLRPFSLMSHGSWGTLVDEVPGSTPTRIDPLHMIEMGMIRPDQLIIRESVEAFEDTLHPFYLSDSFFYDKRLHNTNVGDLVSTKFLPANNVTNPDYNILMIWAPEHRAAFEIGFAGQSAAHARQVPTEFFLLDVRLPMGYDRGMGRYGIGINKGDSRIDTRGWDHTAILDSRAMDGKFPGAPATTSANSGAIIDGGIMVYHYDRTASPTSPNPQNANLHHPRADIIAADGSDLLKHSNHISYNSSYGTNYATHDYFVNFDHFFSNDQTKSVTAAMGANGSSIVRGDGSPAAYEAYRESNLYARDVSLTRLSNGFRLNYVDGFVLDNPATWDGGTFGRGNETGYYKLSEPRPGAPTSNAFIFSPNERNTFPVSHFYDRTWPGTGANNINLSRFARQGNVPSGIDLIFPDSRLQALEINPETGRTMGMRVISNVTEVEIAVESDGVPYKNHGRIFVLRLEQYSPVTSNLQDFALPPIRSHSFEAGEGDNSDKAYVKVTNGIWKIFEVVNGNVEIDTGQTVTVYDGKHTPVTITPANTRVITFSASTDNGGTISAYVDDIEFKSGDRVLAGSTIEFVATPNLGFEVEAWLVDFNPLSRAMSDSVPNTLTLRNVRFDTDVKVVFNDLPRIASSIKITPTEAKVPRESSFKFEATIYDQWDEVFEGVVTWSVTDFAGIAIDQNGLLTADITVPIGTTVTVTAAANNDLYAQAAVTITGALYKIVFGETGTVGGTVTASINGIPLVSGDSVEENTIVTFTANPAPGFIWAGWDISFPDMVSDSKDLQKQTDFNLQLNIVANITINAVFIQVEPSPPNAEPHISPVTED